MSWEIIKFIWSKAPDWANKVWSNIIVNTLTGIAGAFILMYALDQKINVHPQNTLSLLLYFIISVVVFIIAIIIYSCYHIAGEYYKKINQAAQNTPTSEYQPIKQQITKRKKSLPYRFELETIFAYKAEYTVFIKRRWLPNEAKAGKEEFIKSIEISKEPYCATCKGNLLIGTTHWGRKYICEKCKINIDPTYLKNTIKAEFANFIGTVRSHYDEYWTKYCKIYDEQTNHNYEDYEGPLKY